MRLTVMHVLDPQMIVFAGGMIAAGDDFLKRIRRHVKGVTFPVPAAKCRDPLFGTGNRCGRNRPPDARRLLESERS